MNKAWAGALLGSLIVVTGFAGCATKRAATAQMPTPPPELAAVEALLRVGRYQEAIESCIELSRRDPLMPGLAELQSRIMKVLSDRRAKVADLRQSATPERMATDVEFRKAIPDNYESRLSVEGETNSLRTSLSPMERMMRRKVTVNLDNATLSDFVLALGSSEGVNMISDNITDTNRTFSIHAENVPLTEILDYATRNLGVAFHVGDDLIWATPLGAKAPAVPTETRLYRLRKGLASADMSTNDNSDSIVLVDTIKRFVPQDDGADLYFDRTAHVLIVKNTRENLAKVEDLIEALDVNPPQVQIEARFITIGVDDLMELGIDWTLNSPYQVNTKPVFKNGQMVKATETQVDKGATIAGATFSTPAQGLNLTYRGVLTDPMFQAVLHALETSGKSRTLSVPKVTTINNRAATIRIGEDFRYFDEYDIQSVPGTFDNGIQTYTSVLVPVGKPVLEELGIQLEVTPSVGADLRNITLRVTPEISDFVRYEYYQTGSSTGNTVDNTSNTNGLSIVKLPIFRRSRIETELVVQTGETVVMGGLISSAESKVREGVPVLSWLPLVGQLFRHDTVQEKKQNLLIFVTATLLSNRGENLVSLAASSPEVKPAEAGEANVVAQTPAPASVPSEP